MSSGPSVSAQNLATTSTRNPGRVAGFIYLLLVIFGPLRLIYIPNKLFVSGDATATSHNIVSHELLFRLGIAADLVCAVVLIFLVLALYRLFEGVDRNLAALMVIVGGIMPSTIYFINVVNDGAALMLASGADYLSVFNTAQREALALLFVRLHHQMVVGAEILWGLWLFPLGMLTYRSRFLPRFLGVWLIINGAGYIGASFTGILLPAYEDTFFKYAFPALQAEVVFMLWLVIKGAQPQPLRASPTLAAAD